MDADSYRYSLVHLFICYAASLKYNITKILSNKIRINGKKTIIYEFFESTHDEVRERDLKVIESRVPQVMQAVLDESI